MKTVLKLVVICAKKREKLSLDTELFGFLTYYQQTLPSVRLIIGGEIEKIYEFMVRSQQVESQNSQENKMAFNLSKESQSFWKIWKHGTHAQILSEILKSDEFHAQAKEEIVDVTKQADLVKRVVRMTGRRIGQELANKAGRNVERDIYSDEGSAFMILEPGVADELASAIIEEKKIKDLLEKKDEDDINEIVFLTSRMTGRALGKLLGVEPSKIISIGKKILEKII